MEERYILTHRGALVLRDEPTMELYNGKMFFYNIQVYFKSGNSDKENKKKYCKRNLN